MVGPGNKIRHPRPIDLTGAILVRAKFPHDASLEKAKLAGADLTGMDLTGVTLAGADLTGATWPKDAVVPEGWQRGPAMGIMTKRHDPPAWTDN